MTNFSSISHKAHVVSHSNGTIKENGSPSASCSSSGKEGNELRKNLKSSNALFKNKLEEENFLKGDYEFSYELSRLRETVNLNQSQKISIPLGVHIPSVADYLIKTPEHTRKDPKILRELGLLKEEQFGKVKLKPAHEEHLLSNGVILHLVSGATVDLQAFSHVPEKYVKSGILEVINDESLDENLDKSESIITNMVKSGLFVNIYSGIPFRTPLHEAASSGLSDIVGRLLENSAEASLNLKDEDGYTPLDLAGEDVEIVSILKAHLKKCTLDSFSMKTA